LQRDQCVSHGGRRASRAPPAERAAAHRHDAPRAPRKPLDRAQQGSVTQRLGHAAAARHDQRIDLAGDPREPAMGTSSNPL